MLPDHRAQVIHRADGTFLVVGGNQTSKYTDEVKIPELYDPVKDTWTEMAEQTNPRPYHSTAILLPEGVRAPVTFGAVVVALAITGSVSARFGGAHRGRAVARVVVGGAVAMVVTYAIGHLVGAAV